MPQDHVAAVLLGASGLLIVDLSQGASPLPALTGLVIAVMGASSALPVFWEMANRLLSGAAAAVALINSVGNLARSGSPYMLSAARRHSLSLTARKS